MFDKVSVVDHISKYESLTPEGDKFSVFMVIPIAREKGACGCILRQTPFSVTTAKKVVVLFSMRWHGWGAIIKVRLKAYQANTPNMPI